MYKRQDVGLAEEVKIKEPAIRLDMKGYHLYPSFVDLHSSYGLPKSKLAEWSRKPQYESDKKGAYGWNQAIRPEINSAAVFVEDEKEAKSIREAGIGALLVHVQDGIARGTGVLVMPVDNPRDQLFAQRLRLTTVLERGHLSRTTQVH